MKKTTSFHLECDILQEIEDYKTLHNLSSRNAALERMILEMKALKKELEYTKPLSEYAKQIINSGGKVEINIQQDKNPQQKQESKISNKNVRKSIKNAFEEMPD